MTDIRFIAGSGRSGTTWILDALASANKLRSVFEPLHPYLSEVGKRYAHRALSPDEEHPQLQEFLFGVCAGRGPRLWTQYRHQRRWLLPPAEAFWSKRDAGRTKRHWVKFLKEVPRMTLNGMRRQPLVKCIRANLMLPWLSKHLACRVVLVVRHPGAVVESELRGRWNAEYALKRFKEDARLHELTQDRYQPLLAKDLTHVESLTLRWVIENQWVLETARARGIPVVYYEALRSTSETAWSNLCSALSLPHPPDRRLLTRPSQQSSGERRIVPLRQSESPRWMRGLSAADAGAIQGVLDVVGFREYSIDDPNPCAEKAEVNAASRAVSSS